MKAQIKAEPNLTLMKPDNIPHLLLPGEVGAVLEFIITDKDGKVVRHEVRKSESFVRQFLDMLWIQMAHITELNGYKLTDTGGVVRSMSVTVDYFACDALASSVLSGIIVGTGNAAPTITDYVLQTPVAHGVGAGQLQYGAVTFGAPASDGTTSQFTITRNFANGSGGDITVNEIGLYVECDRGANPNLYYVMTIRDVIGGGIAVLNGQTLTVNYRPQAVI